MGLIIRKADFVTVKRVLSGQKSKIGFQDRLSLNAGLKYCRMLQEEHSAILSTFIKLSFVIKIFVLSIFEWLLKTGFTAHENNKGTDQLAYLHSLISVFFIPYTRAKLATCKI